jgi:murein DD-endopeptidase MepM/ murein hydrolase activator NlpD
MHGLSGMSSKKKKTICFCILVLIAVSASVVFASMAAERAGMYWIGLDNRSVVEKNTDNRGFIMVDVSDLSSMYAQEKESNEGTEIVPIGIGPLPSVPSLTTEELKLYGILSRGDGLILSEDKNALDEDIHWQEVILEPGDTLASVAKEYGIQPEDIRRANDLKPNENPDPNYVLYIPDSKEYVLQTLVYVRKLNKAEADLEKRGKPLEITAYVVKDGDTLWSISNQFNLELDTIIGSNKLSNINMLKPGTTLRIPNQDGIFVKVSKKDTVAELADKYGSFKESIYVANQLDHNVSLVAGKEIFLPGAKIAAVAESSSSGEKRITSRGTRRAIVVISSGRLRWPVMGQISSSFGWRRSPFGRRRVFHSGLDIRAPRGRGIVAAGDGRIVYAGWMSGYGKAIVVSHAGGIATLYGHCSSLVAGNGDYVHAGQLIARVGSTGRSTGNHLHFEVRRNGAPMSPLRYLR